MDKFGKTFTLLDSLIARLEANVGGVKPEELKPIETKPLKKEKQSQKSEAGPKQEEKKEKV